MTSTIVVRCPACDARIRAPGQLLGQSRRCPGCGVPFVVRPQPPRDAGPILVTDEPAPAPLGVAAGVPPGAPGILAGANSEVSS